MNVQPSFILDGSTLAAIAAVLGTMGGAIGFLFRSLVAAKDERIAALQQEIVDQRAILLGQIAELKTERDRFRDLAYGVPRRRAGDTS